MLYTCTRGEKTALPKKEVQKMADQVATKNETFVLKVPAIFWDDHFSRDLDFTSVEISRNKLNVTLKMNEDAIYELYSDASHYATAMGEWGDRSVINSAKSTVKSLDRQYYNGGE
jgi:hypothetical protein